MRAALGFLNGQRAKLSTGAGGAGLIATFSSDGPFFNQARPEKSQNKKAYSVVREAPHEGHKAAASP